MPKLLEISVVCLMIGIGIIATVPILYGLNMYVDGSIGFNLRKTIDLFAIGMTFGAIGSILRSIHYWIKRQRKN